MKPLNVLALTVTFGVSLGAGMRMQDAAREAKPKVTTVMHVQLADAFTPGREVLLDLVEIPPNAALERHWHPGEEFHYYLEGDVEIQLDGQAPVKGAPGTGGHVPFKRWHRAVAGAKGAKVLVFRVHTKGEPWRYLEEGRSGRGGAADIR